MHIRGNESLINQFFPLQIEVPHFVILFHKIQEIYEKVILPKLPNTTKRPLKWEKVVKRIGDLRQSGADIPPSFVGIFYKALFLISSEKRQLLCQNDHLTLENIRETTRQIDPPVQNQPPPLLTPAQGHVGLTHPIKRDRGPGGSPPMDVKKRRVSHYQQLGDAKANEVDLKKQTQLKEEFITNEIEKRKTNNQELTQTAENLEKCCPSLEDPQSKLEECIMRRGKIENESANLEQEIEHTKKNIRKKTDKIRNLKIKLDLIKNKLDDNKDNKYKLNEKNKAREAKEENSRKRLEKNNQQLRQIEKNLNDLQTQLIGLVAKLKAPPEGENHALILQKITDLETKIHTNQTEKFLLQEGSLQIKREENEIQGEIYKIRCKFKKLEEVKNNLDESSQKLSEKLTLCEGKIKELSNQKTMHEKAAGENQENLKMLELEEKALVAQKEIFEKALLSSKEERGILYIQLFDIFQKNFNLQGTIDKEHEELKGLKMKLEEAQKTLEQIEKREEEALKRERSHILEVLKQKIKSISKTPFSIEEATFHNLCEQIKTNTLPTGLLTNAQQTFYKHFVQLDSEQVCLLNKILFVKEDRGYPLTALTNDIETIIEHKINDIKLFTACRDNDITEMGLFSKHISENNLKIDEFIKVYKAIEDDSKQNEVALLNDTHKVLMAFNAWKVPKPQAFMLFTTKIIPLCKYLHFDSLLAQSESIYQEFITLPPEEKDFYWNYRAYRGPDFNLDQMKVFYSQQKALYTPQYVRQHLTGGVYNKHLAAEDRAAQEKCVERLRKEPNLSRSSVLKGGQDIFHEAIALTLLADSIKINANAATDKDQSIRYEFSGPFLRKAQDLTVWSIDSSPNSRPEASAWSGIEVGWKKVDGQFIIIHGLPF